MSELFNLNVSEFEFLETVNPYVSKYKCYIASEDTIANNFIFDKKVLDDMKSTVVSSPVVAGFINNDDGSLLGGHYMDYAPDQNGKKVRTPEPIGVGYVLDSEPFWEIYKGKNFLTCYVHIWDDMYGGLKNLSERNIWQSMQVELDYINEGKRFRVTKCDLKALCILENVQPAFTDSTFIKVKFSSEEVNNNIQELKEQFETYSSNPSKILLTKKNKTEKDVSKESFIKKEELGTGKLLKVDKSKESISDSTWGNEDKSALKKDCLKSPNYKTICKDVFMEVDENGLKEGNESDLKYPVMEKKGDTLVYNRYGLASAKAYAEKNNETQVLAKVNAIYKKLGLNEEKKKEGGAKYSMNNFKEMFKKMKSCNSKFTIDYMEDSYYLLDFESNCMYVIADDEVCKMPYVIDESYEDKDDDSEGRYFTLKEDEKEKMGCHSAMSIVMSMIKDKEKCMEEDMSKKIEDKDNELSKKEEEINKTKEDMSSKLSEKEKEIESKDTEIGKAFAKVKELETELSDAKEKLEGEVKKVEQYAQEFKKKEELEKKEKMNTLMSRKEFSIFTDEEKQELINSSLEVEYESFENKMYAIFGKKIKDTVDFSNDGTAKVSFMYTGEPKLPTEPKEEDLDIYSKIRKENNIK